MGVVSVPGVGRVNIVRSGQRGPTPILFLHGAGFDATWWGDQFAAFAPRRDVIAVDLPGHGRSDALSVPPSFPVFVEVVHRVIEAIGAPEVHVVGVSMGGMIAQAHALAHPMQVRSMSLVATVSEFEPATRDVLRDRARIARAEGMARIAQIGNQRWFPAAFRDLRPDVLDRAATCVEAQDAEFHAGLWDMIVELDLTDALRAISCPTLIVVGDQDPNVPPPIVDRMTRAVPDVTLVVFEGVGHFPPVEVPDEFNERLTAFLSDVEEAAR